MTKRNTSLKEKKLRENLKIDEKVLLADRIKKKSALRKFYKQSVQNIAYFNRDKLFSIRKNRKLIKLIITGSKIEKTIKF